MSFPPKKVTNADSGTADIIGGDDWDKLADYYNNIDNTTPAVINTATKYRDQKLKLRNPANTFDLTFVSPYLTADGFYRIGQPYKYVIINELDGATYSYYCKNQITGRVESGPNTDPDAVLQYALTNCLRAGCYVGPGSYPLSAGFTGLIVSQTETSFIMDQGAQITVPQGFTGDLFLIGDGISFSHIRGGRLSEGGTPQRLWTAYHLKGDTGGVNTNHIADSYIRFSKNAIHLDCSGANGWVNGNTIRNVFSDQHTIGILYTQGVTKTSLNGMNWNTFENISLQSYAGTTNGVKNITGVSQSFKDIKVWDIPAGMPTSNITTGGVNTKITGGIMTNQLFEDLGTLTYINDDWQGVKYDGWSVGRYSSFGRKWGEFTGGSNAASSGIWNTTMTSTLIAGPLTTYTNGTTTIRATTAATTASLAGWRTNYLYTFRGFNPRMKVKFALGSTTNQNLYIGFQTVTTASAGDDQLNAKSGVMLYLRAADTTFQIAYNDGTGATVFESTGVAVNTSPHVIEIVGDDLRTRFLYRMDSGVWTVVNSATPTVDTPAQQTKMGFTCELITQEAVAHNLDLFYSQTETN